MAGFPRAVRRLHPTRSDAFVGELLAVDGNIKPATGSRLGYYGADQHIAGSAELWQGMSRAGAFCNDRLVGVAPSPPSFGMAVCST
jgi:pentose-5-phosphate-3-epimerase